jgi:hypothetical protein
LVAGCAGVLLLTPTVEVSFFTSPASSTTNRIVVVQLLDHDRNYRRRMANHEPRT